MRLHHIGKVVRDLQEDAKYYKDTFGLDLRGEPVVDEIQKVKVAFVETGWDKNLTIELIQPISKDSPVNKFLEKGGGIHHFCFEVDDIHEAVQEFRNKGALILGKLTPGRGHNNKLTLWLYTSRKELVELLEQ